MRLKDFCIVDSGTGFPIKYQGSKDKPYPFYKVSDMNVHGNEIYMGISNNYIDNEDIKKMKGKLFPANSIIFPKIGMAIKTNKKRMLLKPSLVDNNVMVLLPKENAEPRFIYYYLLSIDIFQFANATTAPSIRKSDIEEHEVFFPKRNVQKQIVEMLDKSELLKTRRRLSNEETDKLIQSIFYTMFGDPITNDRKWNTDTLGNICGEFQNGIGKNKEFYGKGTKVANIGDLYDWCKFRPLKYSLLEVSDEEIKTYCLKKGDLVFVRSSVKKEGVAYCSAYDSEEECLFSSFMIRTHPKKIVNSVWLSFCLRIKEMHDYLVRMSNTGTITNISQPLLKSIKIIVPPTDIQEKFVSIVEMVESIREHQKKSTKDINQLFDALMQKAFAGDLIVE